MTNINDLADVVDPDLPSVHEAFSVTDESSANWLVRKVLEARAYKHRRTKSPGGMETVATKFGFIDCACATEAGESKSKFLLLTTAKPDGSHRHEAVYVREGELLLSRLVDGLARLGSRPAKAAWNYVCGTDANFPSAPDEVPPPNRSGEKR